MKEEREIKPFIKNGKPMVSLEKDGQFENFSVALLVAQSFVPNPNNYKYVKHKDGNLENCAATNLYWSQTE